MATIPIRTPGQIAYEAFWSTDDHLAWGQMTPEHKHEWEVAAAAVLAAQPVDEDDDRTPLFSTDRLQTRTYEVFGLPVLTVITREEDDL